MKKRLFSFILLWCIILAILYYEWIAGAVWILTSLALVTQYEFYAIVSTMGYKPLKCIGIAFGLMTMIGPWYMPDITGINTYSPGDTIAIVTILLTLLIFFENIQTKIQEKIIPTLLGVLYVPFLLQFYVHLVRDFANAGHALQGLIIVIWLIAVAKFADVGGLLIGSLIGKHKMAPHISPKKTWEGAIGGVLTSVCLGALSILFFKNAFPAKFTLLSACILAIPISILGILSDLIESILKRKAQIKDSGNIIPGIGGAFDLTDSLIFTAPLGYIVVRYLFL